MKAKSVKIKRGRPSFSDDSIRKSVSMTVCLTSGTHEGLKRLAKSNRLPTASFARKIIDEEVEKQSKK